MRVQLQIFILCFVCLGLSWFFLGACNDEASNSVSQESKEAGEKTEQGASSNSTSSDDKVKSSEKESANSDGKSGKTASGKKGVDLHSPALPEMPEELIGKDVVATVNGNPIPGHAVRTEVNKIKRKGAKISAERLGRIKKNIVKRLIDEELIRQAIKDNRIKVSRSDVDAEYKKYKKRFKSDDHFENYIKQGKRTEENIREEITEKMAMEKLIEKRSSTTVSNGDAQAFYEKNKRFYVEKEAVHAQHILIKMKCGKPGTPTEDPEEEKKGLIEIAKAKKALKNRSFAMVAKEYSQGPTASKGGDLGFFSRGQMVKAFEDEAFSMEPGDISEPVRTRFGYHVIKLIDKREERQQPFEEVRGKIEESLTNKKYFQTKKELIETMRKEAEIVHYLQ